MKYRKHILTNGFLFCVLLALSCADGTDPSNSNVDSPWAGSSGEENGTDPEIDTRFPSLGDEQPETTPFEDCTPECGDAECGNDGCNGLCGSCPIGMACTSGVCTEEGQQGGEGNDVCIPNCALKTCGYDGCDSLCGICSEGSCNEQTGTCITDPEDQQPPTNIACEAGTACIYPPEGSTDVYVSIQDGLPEPLSGGDFPSGVFVLTDIQIYPDSLSGGDSFPFEVIMNNAGGTHGSAVFAPPHFGLNISLNIYAAFPSLEESTYLNGIANGGGCSSVFQGNLYVDLLECYEDQTPDFPLPQAFGYANDGNNLLVNFSFSKDTLISFLDDEYTELAEAVFQEDLEIVFTFAITNGP